MCMKYVNVSVQCFDRNPLKFLGGSGISALLDSVKCVEKDGKYVISRFDIVTFINVRGTTAGENPQNPLDQGSVLDFRVRLTKLDDNPEKQVSYDLKDFVVDLSDDTICHRACFKYAEQVEVINVDNFELNETGHYVIKILVKKHGAELYDIQLAHSLHIIK